MSIEHIISERRTVHSYQNDEVPEKILLKAIELATYAPNHKLTFPFLFVRIWDIARKKLAQLAVELKGKEVVRRKFESEGSITFFAQKLSPDEIIRKEDYATMACAVQNFSLYLWEQGYGTKWSTGKLIKSDKLYDLLGLDQSQYEIVGMLWAGQYKSVPPKPERPAVESFMKVVP